MLFLHLVQTSFSLQWLVVPLETNCYRRASTPTHIWLNWGEEWLWGLVLRLFLEINFPHLNITHSRHYMASVVTACLIPSHSAFQHAQWSGSRTPPHPPQKSWPLTEGESNFRGVSCACSSEWSHTHLHVSSTNWTRENNRNHNNTKDRKVIWRDRSVNRKCSSREIVGGKYNAHKYKTFK